jgi:DNA invertase Pin-like site-specific DNA recombinase
MNLLSEKVYLTGHRQQGPPVRRTALYVRVSTAQHKPDLQRDGLRSDAERLGFEVRTEYTDVAVSGRKEGRPPLHALRHDARLRAFECGLVWNFDRLARRVAHL